MKKIFPVLVLLLVTALQAFSQRGSGSDAYRRHGDTQYQYYYYRSAIDFYKKALIRSPDIGYVMLQLAKSYVKTNQPVEAEKWFIQARAKHAPFTLEDYNQYARVLVTLKKRNQAEALLESILKKDPYAYLARAALADLRNFEKYYLDSASVHVDSISINTSVSEFAPAYYKEGIVFTSARLEGPWRRKYHWDNSHFLNLYYSPVTSDKHFGKALLFESERNTRYHEGPAVFYNQYKKMILNRNQTATVEGKENVYERRLALYDALYDEGKSHWDVTPLPFNDVAHSYAHPSISEDGNTLYFISDKPGGYGGTDIYRVVRTDSVWGKPFNLGPAVNTAENEVFPYFINNTLYFGSNGHGGLGGTDLFQSTMTINGFTPPVNLGYPLNSTADDFSLITRDDERNGYIASARHGNDDLFSFNKPFDKINILAHIYDSLDHKPLAGANIQILTNNGNDSTLNADDNGDFSIELPEETAYVIIGTKDGKIGMVSDIAVKTRTHQIPAYGDTSRIACIGFIENQDGLPKEATVISILDQTTGKKIDHPGDKSQITFRGEKGHNYHVEIQDSAGHHANHTLAIGLNDKDPKIWTMILPDAVPMNMAARVFKAEDNLPVANAQVNIVTFGETDQELTTDADGMVEFKLKEGSAFHIIGSKDNLRGMTSGTAEMGKNDKASLIIPVPLYGESPTQVLAIGLVTNTRGDLVDARKATVVNKKTGEKIPVQAEKGVLTFKGEHGNGYNITVSHDDYLTTLKELLLPENGPDIQKFNVILEDKPGLAKQIPIATIAAVKIAENIKTGKSQLLLVDTDKGTSKVFIKSGETLSEITERDSLLYHQTPRGNEYLAKGMLFNLRKKPFTVLQGLEKSHVTLLRNIYFDFDKSNLDDGDKEYLRHLKSILDLDHTSRLIIAGHADERGTDAYNIKLSQRRVQSVSKYLITLGVPKNRIVRKAFGESLPAVKCYDGDCSEEDHQKNRRAEFVISQDEIIATPHIPQSDLQ